MKHVTHEFNFSTEFLILSLYVTSKYIDFDNFKFFKMINIFFKIN